MSATTEKFLADFDSVRQAVRQAAEEDGLSIPAIATEAGVGRSTFQAFMNGTYAGNNNQLAESTRIWLSSRAKQAKVKSATPPRIGFVQTPSATSFMSLLEQAQFDPDMVTLCGEPGVGKTEACREYQRRNSNVFLLTGEPGMRSPYAVLEHLCDLLDVRESSSVRRSRAIARFLIGRRALIVIDEAQHISLSALDQLRALHDNPAVRVGMALVGHPDIKLRMQNGGPRAQFAQLDSRFGMHLLRRKPLAGDVAALLDAGSIFGKEERRLLSAVANKPGGLRKMDRTLRVARMLATGQDVDAVGADHIIMADAQLSNTAVGGAA